MAEEQVKDALIDEDEQLKAQLDAIKRAEQPPPPEEAKAAEPIPEEEKPVEVKAEEKPPVVTKPESEETRPPAGKAWQALRAQEKRLQDQAAELEAERQRLAALQRQGKPEAEPTFDEQPADYLRKGLEQERQERLQLQQRLEQQAAKQRYDDYINGIRQEEQVFEKDHPDYRKATEYLIDKDIKQWERAGLSTLHTNQVLQAARSNDPRYSAYRQQVSRLSNDPSVLKYAEEQGKDPEEVAAYVTARDTWLTQRRDLLAEGARARGVSVAQSAYEEAVDRGWSGNPQDSSPKEDAARARVKQAQEVSAAARSLSDSGSAEAGPEVRVLKNRQQVMELDDESLDALIKSGNYRQLG